MWRGKKGYSSICEKIRPLVYWELTKVRLGCRNNAAAMFPCLPTESQQYGF